MNVRLNMIGAGELEKELKAFARTNSMDDYVTFYGFLSPEEVRDKMEESDLFFFTSNHLEGWGAVVTEAMNSMCAVAAGTMAGAAPYLIKDGENGVLYGKESFEAFDKAIWRILKRADCGNGSCKEESIKEACFKMGQKAYASIADLWTFRLYPLAVKWYRVRRAGGRPDELRTGDQAVHGGAGLR